MLAAHLVKDINPLPFNPPPSAPVEIAPGVALFTHTNSAFGHELFRTDGAAGGTYEVKDIFPGRQPSNARDIMRAGSIGYFVAHDGPEPSHQFQPAELWRSDGTAAGTFAVADNEVTGVRAVGALTPAGPGNRLFFLGQGAGVGDEWYVTDGQPGDARLVADLFPGIEGVWPTARGTQGSVLLFQSQRRPGVLYASDGTAAGTGPIATGVQVDSGTDNIGQSNVSYSNVGFANSGFVRVVDLAYFVDQDTGSLWRTDGTAAGTAKVIDRAMPDFRILEAVAAGGAVFFAGNPRPDENALHVYRYHPADGFSRVRLASGQSPARVPGYPTYLTPAGDTLYFTAAQPGQDTRGVYRVRAGGSTAERVANVPAIWGMNGPFELTGVGDTLYFSLNGVELWRVASPDTPGTRVTTFRDVHPDLGRAPAPIHFAPFGDKLLFSAFDAAAGSELFLSDGTAQGTRLIGDTSPMTRGSRPTTFAPFDGRYLFVANDGVRGTEPHVTDGTGAGTYMLADATPGPVGSGVGGFARVMTEAGPRALFSTGAANGNAGPVAIWSTDGTPGGTRRVKTLADNHHYAPIYFAPGTGPSQGLAYFVFEHSAGRGNQVWRSDGTDVGTYRITDLAGGVIANAPNDLIALPDGSLLFAGDDGGSGMELWKTGPDGGAVLLRNIRPDPDLSDPDLPATPKPGSVPQAFTRVGGHVYFSADDGAHGRELWRTDGTAEGTRLVADIQPGPGSSDPGYGGWGDNLVEFGGHAYFSAWRADTGHELWRTDGTPAGTALVKDLLPGPQGSEPGSLRAGPDRLYLAAGHLDVSIIDHPLRQVWSTDGTSGGTAMIVPPTAARDVGSMEVVGGKLFFAAALVPSTGVQYSSELFTTDGTPGGTRLVADLGGDSWTSGLTSGPMPLPDGSILVAGTDGVKYEELFRFDNPWVPSVVGRHLFYNNSPLDGRGAAGAPGDEALGDDAIAAGKAALLPGGAPSFDNVSSYSRGINGVMIDVHGLPATTTVGAADFVFKVGAGGDPATWAEAPAPSAVTVRRPAEPGQPARVTLVWPDGTIRNGWLQVTVKANANTGLASPDVFSFGSLIGETGDAAAPLRVTAADLVAVRRSLFSPSAAGGRYDIDRNGRVDARDLALVRASIGKALAAPTPAPAAQAVPPSWPRALPGRTATRRVIYELSD